MTNNIAPAPKGHPKGLYILFATEMWERFNFYGMRAMLVLFMTKALLFDKAFASNLYGSYLSLIYLTPLLGGFVADRYWGNRRSIIAGGIVMAIGELILFACGTLYKTAPDISIVLFFSGLGLMIAGNGFFKPNISSLVGQLYPKNDHRKDAAYTIFYMGINTGGALGPFVCGLFGDTGDPTDFRWAFLIAGIGMVLSVIVQKLYQHKYVVDPDNKVLGLVPENSPKTATSPIVAVLGLAVLALACIGLLYLDTKINYLFYLLVACIVIIPAIIFMDKSLDKIEKNKVLVIFVVCFFVICLLVCKKGKRSPRLFKG
ncbi:MAG: oligopeptide:H+ symporter, partial [Flavihumibacter sp.]